MLPEAKGYLEKGGFSNQPAGFILIACFVGGFIGIQVISRFFHMFMPSHVVDCDHTHDDHAIKDDHTHANGHGGRLAQAKLFARRHTSLFRRQSTLAKSHTDSNLHASESTPLLSSENALSGEPENIEDSLETGRSDTPLNGGNGYSPAARGRTPGSVDRRPSMLKVQKRVMSFVKDTKANCDEEGHCYGFTDPCGQECFKHLANRSSIGTVVRAPTLLRTTTGLVHPPRPDHSVITEEDEERMTQSTLSLTQRSYSGAHLPGMEETHHHNHSHDHEHHHIPHYLESGFTEEPDSMDDIEAQHHHHVPENAFLSIGLQTSIAIALHKFPEGFITYATNHANPSLGFNVFLALAVHNISEGFALALPLYMALHSRARAVVWSAALGGLSQPLGAGIAFLWFRLAGGTDFVATPDDTAYGCLFALTAGIMASVALQLFVESLSLNHNRNLSIFCAFIGMTLLGLSNAFTSDAH